MQYRSLSPRQYQLARYLDAIPSHRISQDVLRSIDQRTAGSFKARGWLTYDDRTGRILWNKDGRDSLAAFDSVEIFRNEYLASTGAFSRRFADWFDKPEPKLRVIRRAA